MEIAAKNHLRNHSSLKLSKETEINEDIQEESESANYLSAQDINIRIENLCQFCGKTFLSTGASSVAVSSHRKLMKESITCNDCVVLAEPSKDMNECRVGLSNKRGEGFFNRNCAPNVVDHEQKYQTALWCESLPGSVGITNKGEILSDIAADKCNNAEDFDSGAHIFIHNREDSPKDFAEKLFKCDGYNEAEIARILGKNTDYHCQVGREYLQYFDFSNCSIMEAFREFLSNFALLGETQERERILLYFSERYVNCNLEFLDKNPDTVHTLVCALTLLNTDLHGNIISSGRKKMTCKQFAANLSGLMSDGSDYPKSLLFDVYASVKKHPLPWVGKGRKQVESRSRRNTDTESSHASTKIVNRSLSTHLPFITGKTSVEILRGGLGRSKKLKLLPENCGLLWRKTLLDIDGKKVSLGKRGWKVFSVTLNNLELHLVKKGSNEARAISIHHSLAEETTSDSKRPHVFRLTLADSSVTLYQASSDEEAHKWVHDINKTAALLSAAPLCSPVGSQLVFRKPLLPSAPSTLPLVKQLEKLKELLQEHKDNLTETQMSSEPEESSSEQIVQYFQDKTAHLKYEVQKYQCYVDMLQACLHTCTSRSDSDGESRFNQETSENGSLVSVTPSEPVLASPSALDNSGDFFLSNSADVIRSETGTVQSFYTHLLSPHQRPLTLSPTSSLPNLSPILETPTRGSLANNQVLGSPWGHMGKGTPCESSPNNAEPTLSEYLNKSSNKTVPKASSAVLLSPNSCSHIANNTLRTGYKVGIETTVIDVQRLPGNQEPFPIKKYEMKIAEVPLEQISSTVTTDCQETRPRLTNAPTGPHCSPSVAKISTKSQGHHRMDLSIRPRCSPVSKIMMPPGAKGRQEQDCIEKYSYMQAINPFEVKF